MARKSLIINNIHKLSPAILMGRVMLNQLIFKALAATAFTDERPNANGYSITSR